MDFLSQHKEVTGLATNRGTVLTAPVDAVPILALQEPMLGHRDQKLWQLTLTILSQQPGSGKCDELRLSRRSRKRPAFSLGLTRVS